MAEAPVNNTTNNTNAAVIQPCEDEEVCGQDLLATFWKDDELNDITFESNDGKQVKANRFVFAAKSNVFRRMLLGRFAEADSPVIKLDCQGTVLETLVEYVYTDSAEILRCCKKRGRDRDDDEEEEEQFSSEQIQLLVSLMECGNFYNLPTLCDQAQACIQLVIQACPPLSFVLLQACCDRGPKLPRSEKITAMAAERIRRNVAGSTISAKNVACLSPAVLGGILKDKKLRMKELELFKILLAWVNAADDNNDTKTDHNKNTESLQPTTLEERQTKAKELIQHIRLDKIHPNDLSKTVRPSGLVPTEKLLDLALSAAQRAADEEDIYQQPRYSTWVKSVPSGLVPHTIMVKNAAKSRVNGVYKKIGFFRRGVEYAKKSFSVEDPFTYTIRQCRTQDDQYHWFISILAGQWGLREDIDYYVAPVSETTQHLPPTDDSWEGLGSTDVSHPEILYRASSAQAN